MFHYNNLELWEWKNPNVNARAWAKEEQRYTTTRDGRHEGSERDEGVWWKRKECVVAMKKGKCVVALKRVVFEGQKKIRREKDI